MTEPFTATWNGQPLGQLQAAIDGLQKAVGYSANQAVTAMAINVLKSVRARTCVAKIQGSHKETAQRSLRPGYLTLPGGKRKRTVRDGAGKGHHIDNWRSTRAAHALDSRQWLEASVFDATFPQRKDLLPFKAVGTGKDDVRDYVLRGHPVRKYRGLAKTALGVAMAKVSASGKSPDGADVPRNARAIASRLVSVSRSGNAITIKDNLDYAALAVRGGESGLQQAIQAASNKAIGRIHKAIDDIAKECLSGNRLGCPQWVYNENAFYQRWYSKMNEGDPERFPIAW